MTIHSVLFTDLDDRSHAWLPEPEDTASFLHNFRKTKAYNLAAAIPLLLWYGSSAAEQLPVIGAKVAGAKAADVDLDFIVSTLTQLGTLIFVVTILIFLLLRDPGKGKAGGLVPSLIAMGGTAFGVTLVWLPQIPLAFAMSTLSFLLIIIGVCYYTYVVLYLDRASKATPHAPTLITTGPYAIVRHPLQLAEVIGILGMMLQYLSPLALAIVGLQFGFQFQCMKAEERKLASEFPDYEVYAARTARLIPGVY